MNKFLKNKIIWLTIISISIVLIAIPIMGEESEYVNITLNSLESRIVSENIDVLRSYEALMVAINKKNQAVIDEYSTSGSVIDRELKKHYYPAIADENVNYSQWSFERVKTEKVLEGVNDYFSYQYLVDNITLQNVKVNRLKSNLEMIKTKIELGKETISAQMTAELNIKQEEFVLQNLNYDKERLFLDLNLLLNYDLDTPLVFDSLILPYEKYKVEDLKTTIDHVLVTNGDIVRLLTQRDIEIAKKKIYTDYNSSGNYNSEIENIDQNLRSNNLELKEKKLDIEYQVRSKYNSLLNSYDSLTIKELEIANLEITLKTIKSRQMVGLETDSSVLLARENVSFAKLALDRAKLDYYVAVESFKNYIE